MNEQKIIGYTVAAKCLTPTQSLDDFIDPVQRLIEEGWEPLSGGFWHINSWYAQVMIKRTPFTVAKALEKFAATRQPCSMPEPTKVDCPVVMAYDFTGIK